MEQTTTTLTTAIAELTKQVEQLTLENAKLREGSVPGNDKSSEVISAIIKSIPREVILEVLGVKDVNLEDVDSDVLIEYVSENYGVDEVFSKRQIIEYVKRDVDMDDVYDVNIVGSGNFSTVALNDTNLKHLVILFSTLTQIVCV